jgi:hypothetical protein
VNVIILLPDGGVEMENAPIPVSLSSWFNGITISSYHSGGAACLYRIHADPSTLHRDAPYKFMA